MSRTRYCIIEGCDNEVGKRSKRDICSCCSHGLRYWDDRPMSDMLEYQRKLGIRQGRMGMLTLGKSKRKAAARRPAVATTESRASL